MSVGLKMVWAMVVMVVPGGLLLLAAYVLGRSLKQQHQALRAQGATVDLGEILRGIRMQDIWREARMVALTSTRMG